MPIKLVGSFPYAHNGGAARRPILPVTIINAHDPSKIYPDFPCILDTGADSCFFPNWLCKILGHDFEKGTEKVSFSGICGTTDASLHSNELIIAGHQFKCNIFFAAEAECEEEELGIGLLGQNGFFSVFGVYFDYTNDSFSLFK